MGFVVMSREWTLIVCTTLYANVSVLVLVREREGLDAYPESMHVTVQTNLSGHWTRHGSLQECVAIDRTVQTKLRDLHRAHIRS